jgi:hypothetical protein
MTGTVTLNHVTWNCVLKGKQQNDLKQYYTNKYKRQTCLPIFGPTQPTLTLGQCVVTFCKLTVITDTDKLMLLYVPKTSHTITTFFPETFIPNTVDQDHKF